ncbi:MAG: pyridoxal phosphate-dependent aminotransferase family protein [Eubacteriales bacterium]|nr:pyridoxal phosphate-dependent aminotransferase family protein [Eubacteriales bacterium]MDD3866302.1 pyridoxal phosphate-dependent aminotransferase family protein [Eubacteriales bacterium]MDD4461578.1 pyridoxal phosphate-dependent aminotransferase family protein [Eubacteriales bacterium]
MDLFQKCREFTRAHQAMELGIYPFFHMLTSGQDTEVMMNGQRTLMLGSNNYLGLTADPRVKAAAVKAVEKYGSGCSGSRFLNGTLDIHVELEAAMARFLQKEDCIVFSTGFQSNLSIISAVTSRCDYILSDSMNHASIVDATRLSFARTIKYRHSDMDDLRRLLERCSADEKGGILIVTDGVFSMEGEICNLPGIVSLAREYGARVMVDDAHSIGVLGEHGRGTAEYFGLEAEVDLIMNTFSKTLASLGGCVVGDESVIHYIRHNARPFIFSASIPPAQVAAAHEALRILEAEPQRVRRLNEIAAYMKKGLQQIEAVKVRESGNDLVPIIPILTGSAGRTMYTAKVLLDHGVYVNPVFPPAVPSDSCLLRTSYTATHTNAQLDEALSIIEKVYSEMAGNTEIDFDIEI